MNIKKILKKLLFVDPHYNLTTAYLFKSWNEKFGHYFFRRKYDSKDIEKILQQIGIKRGDNIFVHCSWGGFYNYVGTELDFLNFLIQYIGPEGTIAMPAYMFKKFRNKKIFNVRKTVTAAGIIPELFRKYEGVCRSENPQHSVCAKGPLAIELTKDHCNSLFCFDENSPYYKLSQLNFKILIFGMHSSFIGTILHTMEGTLYKELPYFSNFVNTGVIEKESYLDSNGNEKIYRSYKRTKIPLRTEYFHNKYFVWRYFDKTEYALKNIGGLNIAYYNAEYVYNRLRELAYKGKVIYITPKFHN